MKILFTGSSSFTGYWFIRQLVEAGHEVVATFNSPPEWYDAIRSERVSLVRQLCRPEFSAPFGSQRFMQIIQGDGQWDMLCHHSAEVTGYKNADFDILGALNKNCLNAREVFDELSRRGCGKVVITGSIFEQGEGLGTDELRAFSPYGVSKALTAELFKNYTSQFDMCLGKFVIPNPFGPYEEPRFTNYLMNCWFAGKVAEVRTPAYVRDNIHVGVLAQTYANFVDQLSAHKFTQINPSGYVESMGAFVARLSREVSSRSGCECEYILSPQTRFEEPLIRVNIDNTIDCLATLVEKELYDEFVDWYQTNKSA